MIIFSRKEDESGEKEERLLRLNPEGISMEPRPKNPGKEITENLPGVEIDPKTMDLYSNIKPLSVVIDAMEPLPKLVSELEYPKWNRRGKVGLYGWGDEENYGFIRQFLEMEAGQRDYEENVADEKEEDLSLLKEEIKDFAEERGMICGITKVDRRFIAEAADEAFPYDTAVVLGMPIDEELMGQIPHPEDKLWDFDAYIKLGKRLFELTDFVRSKGYRAYARIPLDGVLKYPPHAIMAGLGELGAGGWVITKEHGPWVRWTMISIEADLEPDDPVDLNFSEYCEDCRRCIEACPGNAITEEKVWWRGVLKHKVDDKKCWPFFEKFDGCGICLKVCPPARFGYEECMEAYEKDGTILGKEDWREY